MARPLSSSPSRRVFVSTSWTPDRAPVGGPVVVGPAASVPTGDAKPIADAEPAAASARTAPQKLDGVGELNVAGVPIATGAPASTTSPTGPERLRVADDGRWLEVLPLPVMENDEPSAETTVIWQGDDGLITIRRAEVDRSVEPPVVPPATMPAGAATAQLLDEARRALAAGRFFEARRSASLARAYGPEDPDVYALLGELAAVQNDFPEAEWNFERAEQYSGRRGRFALRLAEQRKEQGVVGTLERFETEHFSLTSPWRRDEGNGALLALEVEAAWQRVRQALGVEPGGLVSVVVYQQEQFSERSHGVQWAAGDFDGRVRVPTGGLGTVGWRSLFVHELTHAFVASRGADVPAWLNEGLAEWVGYQGLKPPLECQGGHLVPLADLERSFGTFSSCAEARKGYDTARHAIEQLIARHGDTAVPRLMAKLRTGSDRAYFREAYGQSMRDFVEAFDAERAR